MLDISTISAISAVIAAVGVIVGVIFTVLELRNLVKTRQTDLVMRLYSTFGSQEFNEARWKIMAREYKDFNDYEKKHGLSEIVQVGSFFEGIGVLLHRKLVDISLVDDLLSSAIKLSWDKMKPMYGEWRKRSNRPQLAEWFEYLYNEMQKREQRLQQIRH